MMKKYLLFICLIGITQATNSRKLDEFGTRVPGGSKSPKLMNIHDLEKRDERKRKEQVKQEHQKHQEQVKKQKEQGIKLGKQAHLQKSVIKQMVQKNHQNQKDLGLLDEGIHKNQKGLDQLNQGINNNRKGIDKNQKNLNKNQAHINNVISLMNQNKDLITKINKELQQQFLENTLDSHLGEKRKHHNHSTSKIAEKQQRNPSTTINLDNDKNSNIHPSQNRNNSIQKTTKHPTVLKQPQIQIELQSGSKQLLQKNEELQKTMINIKYEDLQKPLIQVYKESIARPTKHIKTAPPMYLVVGPKDSGKSTFIFALQGNQVTKKINSSEKKLINPDTEDNNTVHLISTKTINIPTPNIVSSFGNVKQGVKIYYIGKNKSKQPIAFCDTPGLLWESKDNISNADKIVGDFAPYFVLKTNQIGGIVFVVDAADIKAAHDEKFFMCINFLKNYVAMNNLKVLKESVMLIITKAEEDSQYTRRKDLAKLIKKVYEDYYKGSNDNQGNEQATRLGLLKPFFSLFLKKDIAQHEIDTISYKLLDKDRVRFFYPYKTQNVRMVRKKLLGLRPLDHKLIDDHLLSQKLSNKILDRINNIRLNIYDPLLNIEQTSLPHLKQEVDKLQKQIEKALSSKKQLKNENNTLLSDKTLERVVPEEERSVEELPLSPKEKSGFLSFLYKLCSCCCSTSNGKDDKKDYLLNNKKFSYTGSEPIYKIEIKTNNGETITWMNPTSEFIHKHFRQQLVDNNTTTLVSKDGIKIEQAWEFEYGTTLQEKSPVQFFIQKRHVQKIENNQKEMIKIDTQLKELQKNKKEKKQDFFKKQEKVRECRKQLKELEEEMSMIACWGKHIVKKESPNQTSIAQCIKNYKKLISNKHQISIEGDNDYNYMPPLLINNTNSKHSDYQPGLWLGNSNNSIEDEEEIKEDDSYKENISSSSNLSSTILGTTAVVFGGMSKKKN